MSSLIHRAETYQIIGKLFDVHNNLGGGFLEIVYKDAIQYEFDKAEIKYEREKRFDIRYKDIVLPHHF